MHNAVKIKENQPGVTILYIVDVSNNNNLKGFLSSFLKHNSYYPFEIIIMDQGNHSSLAETIGMYENDAYIWHSKNDTNKNHFEALKDNIRKSVYPKLLIVRGNIIIEADYLPKIVNEMLDASILSIVSTDYDFKTKNMPQHENNLKPTDFFLCRKDEFLNILKESDWFLSNSDTTPLLRIVRNANIEYAKTCLLSPGSEEFNNSIFYLKELPLYNEKESISAEKKELFETGKERTFSAVQAMQEAEKAIKQKEWEKALNLTSKVIDNKNMPSARAYILKGRALMHKSFIKEAESVLQEGLLKYPADWRVAFESAQVAKKIKDWNKVVQLLGPFVYDQGSEVPLVIIKIMSQAFTQLGKYEEADKLVERGFLLAPEDKSLFIQHADNAHIAKNWPEAVKRWEDVLKRTNYSLPAKKLTRISKAYFETGNFVKAKFYLDQALNIDPDDRIALLEQKHQLYTSKVYAVWEVQRGDEQEWMNALPDWHEISSKCKNLLSPRYEHNYNQYNNLFYHLNRANLFWAEELFNNNEPNKACDILYDNLDLVCPGLSDQVKREIVASIKAVRIDSSEKEDYRNRLNDAISGVKEELISFAGWLCLNDLLIWNGLLVCSLVARQRAISRIYQEANDAPEDFGSNTMAARAAVDNGELTKAKHYIKALFNLITDRELANQLLAYTNLFLGNIKAFSEMYYNRFDKTDHVFYNYIQGKNVAIVGSAPTEEMCGSEIDDFDIVLRFNYYGPDSLADINEVGSKTNISMISNKLQKFVQNQRISLELNDLDYILINQDKGEVKNFAQPGLKKPKIKHVQSNNNFFYKGPTAGTIALFDIFKYNPKKVKLFKSNFHLSENPYHKKSFTQVCRKRHYEADLAKVQHMSMAHDHIGQINFFRNLWSKNLIEVDNNCASVLILNNRQYMESMERIYV